MNIEVLSSRLHDYVLEGKFLSAGECLNQYRKEHGVASPYLDIESFMMVRYALRSLGMESWVLRINRKIVSHEKSDFWHRLIYFDHLSGGLGFLVTLELMEDLESQVMGLPSAHLPLRKLVMEQFSQDSYGPKRDRLLIQGLSPLHVCQDEKTRKVYQFALDCCRTDFYSQGYWKKTTLEHLEKSVKQIPEILSLLEKTPFLSSYLLGSLVSACSRFCLWEKAEEILEYVRKLKQCPLIYKIYQVHIDWKRQNLDKAYEVLLTEESIGKESLVYWQLRASLLMELGRFSEAKESWTKGEHLGKNIRAKSHFFQIPKGFCSYKLGHIRETIDCWKGTKNQLWLPQAKLLEEKLEKGDKISPYQGLKMDSIQQKPNHCGPCSLAMIIGWWGVSTSQEELSEKLSEWGCNIHEMGKCAKEYGFAAVFGSRDFDLVKDTLLAGFPVLLDFSYPGGGHFVVAVGYDLNLDLIEVLDPSYVSTWFLSREKFKSNSSYCDYYTLVVCPKDKVDEIPLGEEKASFYYDLSFAYHQAETPLEKLKFLEGKYPQESLEKFNFYRELIFCRELSLGEIEKAREMAEKILAFSEQSIYSCSRLAELYLSYDRTQDALQILAIKENVNTEQASNVREILQTLTQVDPSSNHEYFQYIKGKAAHQIGNYQVALKSLLQSINIYPARGEKFLILSYVMADLGEEEQQLKYLNTAQQISGPHISARKSEINIYQKRNDFTKALEFLEITMQLFPKRKDLLHKKGFLLEKIGRKEEAIECYKALCQNLPLWYGGYHSLIRLYHSDSAEKEIDDLMELMDEKMGNHPDSWCVKASRYIDKFDFEKSLQMATTCLEKHKNYPWAFYQKAYSLEMLGRLEKALEALETTIKNVDPSDYYWDLAISDLGRIGRKMQDMSAFESIFKTAITIAPDSSVLWSAMSDCFLISGDAKAAQEYFKSLYGKVTNKANFAIEAGVLLEGLARLEESREWYSLVPKENSHYENAILGICRTLAIENKHDKVTETLLPLAEIAPSPRIYSLLITNYLNIYKSLEAKDWYQKMVTTFPYSHLWSGLGIKTLNSIKNYASKVHLNEMIVFFEKTIEKFSEERAIDLYLFMAYAYDLLEKKEIALKICRETLEKNPSSGMGWIILADIEFEDGQFEQAVSSAQKSCKTRYAAYPFIRLFRYFSSMDRIEEAFDVCIEGLSCFPSVLRFQELMDDLVLRFGMLEKYLEACQKIYPIVENKGEFLGNQGILYAKMGEDDRAEKCLKSALEFSKQAWIYLNLALIATRKQNFPEAEKLFLETLEVDPHYSYAFQKLAELYSDWYFSYEEIVSRFPSPEKLPSREELLERIYGFYEKNILLNPNDIDFFGSYSKFCSRFGDISAIEKLLPSLEKNCHFLSDVYTYISIGLERLDNIEKAYEYLEKAANVECEDSLKAWTHFRLGRHLMVYQIDNKSAEKWLYKSIESDPEYEPPYSLIVDILEEEDRLEEEFSFLHKGIWALSSPEDLLEAFGSCCSCLKKVEEILPSLETRLQDFSPAIASECLLNFSKGLSKEYDFEWAQKVLSRAEDLYSDKIAIIEAQISVCLLQHDYEKVNQLVTKLLKIDPDNIKGLYQVAMTNLREGNLLAGLNSLEIYFKEGGDDTYALTYLFEYAKKLGLMKEFMQLCKNIYPISSVRSTAHICIGLATFHNGEEEEGRKAIVETADIDASRVNYAQMLLAEFLKNQERMKEALPLLENVVKESPQYYYARSILVGCLIYLDKTEEASEHMPALLREPEMGEWEHGHITNPLLWRYPNRKKHKSVFEKVFQTIYHNPSDFENKGQALYLLFCLALAWGLREKALELAKEILVHDPHSKWLPVLLDGTHSLDLDFAEVILEKSKEVHIKKVSMEQMHSMFYARKKDAKKAIKHAIASRIGHGGIFNGMCEQLLTMYEKISSLPSETDELCEVLFDCVMRYHQGHSECMSWALALLLENNRDDLFQKGLEILENFQKDYTFDYSYQKEVRASVAALNYLRARKYNDEEKLKLWRQKIDEIKHFYAIIPEAFLEKIDIVSP